MNLFRDMSVSAYHHAPIANGSEIFCGIEAEAPRIAQSSQTFSLIASTRTLGAIFHQPQIILAGELQNGIHISRSAVQMHYQHGPGALRKRPSQLFRIKCAA